MSTKNIDICKLEDLDKLRSAPRLNKKQSKNLLNQISHLIHKSDWITIGVMSPTLQRGIHAVRRIEEKFEYDEMKCITLPSSDGPVFLKANQKTGEIHARIEFGLGEGILISCQYYENSLNSKTIGPFPLDFFD
ncbi:DUF1824 family protein [Prochlorococcus sp. MIT 0801]|uniref:DUF1824 family protein n=1 Tax=Prochlorococcus sp. MIT 0801 TaxID=1501269 RepID=UPI0004F8879A|nr:DUF1824 family protein [Prochlorococcus sp. MIT 0801]AIQ96889.1 hypothetical protein EW15_0797 [Prochlorococcus sp. MIT 0801]